MAKDETIDNRRALSKARAACACWQQKLSRLDYNSHQKMEIRHGQDAFGK